MGQKRTGKRTDGAESESSVSSLRPLISVNGHSQGEEDRLHVVAVMESAVYHALEVFLKCGYVCDFSRQARFFI